MVVRIKTTFPSPLAARCDHVITFQSIKGKASKFLAASLKGRAILLLPGLAALDQGIYLPGLYPRECPILPGLDSMREINFSFSFLFEATIIYEFRLPNLHSNYYNH